MFKFFAALVQAGVVVYVVNELKKLVMAVNGLISWLKS